jgi:glutamate racemase
MDERPVAFLDSGVGGLPYAHFFRARNINEKIVYAADRANFPYGPRSRENVTGLAVSLVKKLIPRSNPKLIVVACNAISVSALDSLRENFPGIPVVGTVPAIKPAAVKSRKRCIGILGTQRTVEDPYIADLAAKYASGCTILKEAAPLLVEFVERSWLNSSSEERMLTVKPWVDKILANGADALVLSCTHFLLLKEEFLIAGGSELTVFDSVEGVIRKAESILAEEGLSGHAGAEPILLVTGEEPPEPSWEQLASRFGFNLAGKL